ncbi:DUF2953 domain-containing protein [Petroclostridium sp. X23]|uniref:DUF2953 domain-containing protein n=1 Tax=Petroclostridium sp. X23 TaxID=3045146 RepID=UPI0024AE79DB|nr:DUF2953 domain-containing protein [Petroclostridium sp. X23]WHH59443.1 DUF2953 domain-containing protein [Petroclostridium sp. X23]
MIYLILICIILFILLFVKMNISIEFLRNGENDKAILTLSILKRLIKLEIPFIDTDNKKGFWGIKFSKRIKNKKDEQISDEDKAFVSFSKLTDTMKNGYEQFQKYKQVLIPIRNYTKKRLICEDFIFHFDFGFGDAALTGMASGLIWGACYNTLSIIDNNLVLKQQDIRINPCFNDTIFQIKWYCIFSIRIVHIIIIFFIFIYSIIRYMINKYILTNGLKTPQKYVRL